MFCLHDSYVTQPSLQWPPAQQRMLGNNEHFYPGQDEKDGEDEEEEEELGGEIRQEEGGPDTENGGLEEGLEEKDMTGGRQSWEGKGGEVMKPAAIVVGRQRVERPIRPGNLGNRGVTYMPNQAQLHHQPAIKQQNNLISANQQPHHQGLNALQRRRALMERSMTTMAPLEDSFLTMMVFRIGIPDIKQTVGACSHPKHCSLTRHVRNQRQLQDKQIQGLGDIIHQVVRMNPPFMYQI